jgi:hypothetical protein
MISVFAMVIDVCLLKCYRSVVVLEMQGAASVSPRCRQGSHKQKRRNRSRKQNARVYPVVMAILLIQLAH